MNISLLILLTAALLEAGGDALVRSGMQASSTTVRLSLFLMAAVVLFTYGYVVNAPPWQFGQLLGIYVVFFFVIAQLISWLVFRHPPTAAIWIGGTLIVAGGFVISYGTSR